MSDHLAAPQPGQVLPPASTDEVIDVLVIDDDEAVRGLLVAALTRRNYTFRSAGSGREALELLARHRFKLVVTDIYMPDTDGLELIMRYTRSNPSALILAISGGSKHGGALDSLKPARLLGSQQILHKPFSPFKFLDVVQDMMTRKPVRANGQGKFTPSGSLLAGT